MLASSGAGAALARTVEPPMASSTRELAVSPEKREMILMTARPVQLETRVRLSRETATLKPGPGQGVAQANGLMCHSVNHIHMRPPVNEARWRGVVLKIKKVMGAPIADGEVDTLVKVLLSQNGR